MAPDLVRRGKGKCETQEIKPVCLAGWLAGWLCVNMPTVWAMYGQCMAKFPLVLKSEG